MLILEARIGKLALVFLFAIPAPAQVNSWTNPASGHWEDPSWSLGVLPGAGQSVVITNAGYKAVAIFPSTAANYPGSLTVSNLLLAAPGDGLTTLLLNYAGAAVPLKAQGACEIDTNATLLNLYSSLEVDGTNNGSLFINGGNLFQTGGSFSATNGSTIFQSGVMALTNGNDSFTTVLIGAGGPPGAAAATLAGGDLTGDFYVQSSNTFTIYDGVLEGHLSVGDGGWGTCEQYDGTNGCEIKVGDPTFFIGGGDGHYFLYGGSVTNDSITIAPYGEAFGDFTQAGGQIMTGGIEVGEFTGDAFGSFTLSNGVLLAGSVGIQNGSFTQSAGQAVLAFPLYLQGELFDYSSSGASYFLSGGVLSVPAIWVGFFAEFDQAGGTNLVSGNLHIERTEYWLGQGFLSTSNTWIQGGYDVQDYGTYYDPGVLFQSGGTHVVRNTLTILDGYDLSGGILNASNIALAGEMSVSNGAVIINSGTFSFGGNLQLSGASIALGKLELATNALLDLGPGSSAVSFASSSDATWNAGSLLVVTNWNGNVSGGGTSRFLVGVSNAGLNPAQLAQIEFVNPAGFAPGRYAAAMLATGEIIPMANATLGAAVWTGKLVLTWPGGLVLQNSSNVFGPYLDIGSASAPFTWDITTAPQQFFRLRH